MPDEIIEDRRSIIEAAFEEQEKLPENAPAAPAPSPAPVAQAPAASEGESDSSGKVEAGKEPASPAPKPEEGEADEADAPQKTFPVDKAPASWRAPQKAKWDKLDPDVRQEIVRREREITKTFGENGAARQLYNQFTQAVAPFQARIASLGISPVVAAQELFKADYILTTAPKAQRAQYMAKLISEYDVDILELDAALAGKEPADPVASRVEAMLAERLKPLNQFLTSQQQREQQAAERSSQEVAQTVESMATDPKFPHFEAVRMDMADVIELAAKRGVYLSPEQAYTRAIAMNPEVSKLVADQQQAEASKAAAVKAHAAAQKARSASVSVGGAPGGAPSGASGAPDRRSAIAAAFDSIGGRG